MYLEQRKQDTGSASCLRPSHVVETIPFSTEFSRALMLQYARTGISSNLPTSCDCSGDSNKLDVNHALNCKNGWFGHSST